MIPFILIGIIIWFIWATFRAASDVKPPRSDAALDVLLDKLRPQTVPSTFELRMQPVELGDPPDKTSAHEIQAQGLFPVSRVTNAKMVISVIDATTPSNLLVVIASISSFQEEESTVYQSSMNMGALKPNYGLVRWTRVGIVIPDVLVTAYSGQRSLRVIARLIASDNPPKIDCGYCQANSPGIIHTKVFELSHRRTTLGYIEQQKLTDEAAVLTIRLAMAVAIGDGVLHDSEGLLIKHWAKKRIGTIKSESRAAELKNTLNDAIKAGYEYRQIGAIKSYTSYAIELKNLGLKSMCYEAVELCFDVLAADGHAGAAELEIIERIAHLMGIDSKELTKIKEQRFIKIDTGDLAGTDPLSYLGIDPSWTKEKKQEHLRREFQKWNGRLNSVKEGPERENTQRMLELIASARLALR